MLQYSSRFPDELPIAWAYSHMITGRSSTGSLPSEDNSPIDGIHGRDQVDRGAITSRVVVDGPARIPCP